LVIAAVTALCIVRPALAADALNGKRLGELWCAACHVVTVNQQQASADAPPSRRLSNGQISVNRAS
jgi:hypothetical protein